MRSTYSVYCAGLCAALGVFSIEPAHAADSDDAKAGRFMANLKIGPALGAYNAGHQGAIVLEGGMAVLPDRSLYVLLPLQFQFAQGGGSIIIPVGLQYDIRLPVKGLYVYPRLSIGYAAVIASGVDTAHLGMVNPEFGIKYVYKGRWNFGGEPFSLPIFFSGGGASLNYRILLSAGANF